MRNDQQEESRLKITEILRQNSGELVPLNFEEDFSEKKIQVLQQESEEDSPPVSEKIIIKAGEGVDDEGNKLETKYIARLNEEINTQKVPFWIWIILLVSVIACSSGGMWFDLLPDCPPVLRSCWRLIFTALFQLPGFTHDLYRTMKSNPRFLELYLDSFYLLLLSGFALALHFSFWSISLSLTSLSHSLLFVTMTPILLVTYSTFRWIIWKYLFSSSMYYPPTWIEVLGTLIGFIAAAILAQEAARGGNSISNFPSNGNPSMGNFPDQQPTLLGDFVATLGALAMGIYLSLGASLRQWLSLWLYAFPVTLASGLFCGGISLVFEQETLIFGFSSVSIFGVFGNSYRFLIVTASAMTSGILGHTFANLALEYVSPLLVSILLLNEPLVGSVIGYLVGVAGPPSLLTVLAGLPLMLSASLVTAGNRNSNIHQRFPTPISCFSPST